MLKRMQERKKEIKREGEKKKRERGEGIACGGQRALTCRRKYVDGPRPSTVAPPLAHVRLIFLKTRICHLIVCRW